MKKYARIENGAVVELFETDGDITTMFHPSMIWVACGDNVIVSDTYTDSTFAHSIAAGSMGETFADQVAAYLATVRQTREMILNRLAGIAGRAYRAGNIEMAEAADSTSTALLDITKSPSVMAATSMDALHDAVLAYYKTLVASVPSELRSAFNVVDA